MEFSIPYPDNQLILEQQTVTFQGTNYANVLKVSVQSAGQVAFFSLIAIRHDSATQTLIVNRWFPTFL